MSLLIWFDLFRLLSLFVVIGYAALLDYKTSEVPNKIWIYAPTGLCLTLIEICYIPSLLIPALISLVFTIPIAFLLFYIGGFGGADAKALITIAVSFPLSPLLFQGSMFLYPINVLLFSSMLALFVGLAKHKKMIQFLPFMTIGMVIAIIF